MEKLFHVIEKFENKEKPLKANIVGQGFEIETKKQAFFEQYAHHMCSGLENVACYQLRF